MLHRPNRHRVNRDESTLLPLRSFGSLPPALLIKILRRSSGGRLIVEAPRQLSAVSLSPPWRGRLPLSLAVNTISLASSHRLVDVSPHHHLCHGPATPWPGLRLRNQGQLSLSINKPPLSVKLVRISRQPRQLEHHTSSTSYQPHRNEKRDDNCQEMHGGCIPSDGSLHLVFLFSFFHEVAKFLGSTVGQLLSTRCEADCNRLVDTELSSPPAAWPCLAWPCLHLINWLRRSIRPCTLEFSAHGMDGSHRSQEPAWSLFSPSDVWRTIQSW